MTHLPSQDISARIEDLYGATLADLDAAAQERPPGMLAALLGSHRTLAFAEQSITAHCDRLHHLVQPDREIDAHDVVHVLDCARRLAEAVAVRDTQAQTAVAVLDSLARVAASEIQAPVAGPAASSMPAKPLPAAAVAPGR
ncbi:hypothetical protein [Streptomyces sp. NPDC001508]|uniref:hypothetical protein n=1 Tax=Streptomyces sp. NPDC001508 TaxID=3154656 RepID=UPI003321781E